MMRSGLEGYSGEGRLTLQVAAQIIERISSGLYRSPESSLKELISNAFDADAGNVWIRFYFDYKEGGRIRLARITVTDDGTGMDIDTLRYVFTHVGGSRKETENPEQDPLTPGGRPLIGRLGIGMLSIASACEMFIVRTKKRGQNREFLAEIDLGFLRDKERRTQSMDVFTIGNVGMYSKSVSAEYSQYTTVEISKFTPPFMESIQTNLSGSFVFQNGKVLETETRNFNEDSLEDYFKQLMEWTINGGKLSYGKTKNNAGKLQTAHPLDAAIINLGMMAPVQYLSDGPIKSEVSVNGRVYKVPGTENPAYSDIKNRYLKYNFNVFVETYRGTQPDAEPELESRFKIYKPILYPRDSDIDAFGLETLQPEVYVIEPLSAEIPIDEEMTVGTRLTGYFYHQHKRILPHEYRGILFRVYNVAIGTRFQDDLKLYVTSSIMLWQSVCELYLDKGFQKIVNLDRESLYEGNNVYRHLKYFLENYLTGSIPPRLEIGPDQYMSSVERKFSTLERSLLKKNVGLINIIKGGRKKQLEEESDEPWETFQDELLEESKCDSLLIERTTDPTVVEVKRKDRVLHATLPRVHGDKMWDAIFISICLKVNNQGKDLRNKVIAELLDIYNRWEE